MARALEDTTDSSARTGRASEPPNSASRQTTDTMLGPILIVDDDPDACTILRLVLETEGFDVVIAQSVPAALGCIRKCPPSLIITDYAMPGATGLDLCRNVRSDPRTCAIPILLHTGCDLPETGEALYDRAFEKPTDLTRLSRAIRRMLPASSAPGRAH